MNLRRQNSHRLPHNVAGLGFQRHSVPKRSSPIRPPPTCTTRARSSRGRHKPAPGNPSEVGAMQVRLKTPADFPHRSGPRPAPGRGTERERFSPAPNMNHLRCSVEPTTTGIVFSAMGEPGLLPSLIALAAAVLWFQWVLRMSGQVLSEGQARPSAHSTCPVSAASHRSKTQEKRTAARRVVRAGRISLRFRAFRATVASKSSIGVDGASKDGVSVGRPQALDTQSHRDDRRNPPASPPPKGTP